MPVNHSRDIHHASEDRLKQECNIKKNTQTQLSQSAEILGNIERICCYAQNLGVSYAIGGGSTSWDWENKGILSEDRCEGKKI